MRVLLINPPHSNPTGPTLGLPVLSSYIQANTEGVSSEIEDLSIQSFYYFLSHDRLLSYRDLLERQISQLEAKTSLVYEELVQLKKKHLAKQSIEAYGPHVERSIRVLKDPDLYAIPAERERSIMEVNELLKSIGAVYPHHITLSAGDYRSSHSPFSSSDIADYVNDGDNPYFGFFETWIDRFDFRDVSLIGISISFAKQMLPAIQLAKMIKERHPSIFIQLGGSMMAHLKAELFTPLFNYCDAIVQKEGEVPICNIIDKIRTGQKLTVRDGAVFLDDSRNLVFPARIDGIDVTKEKVPDFSTIRFGDYLVPFPVVPLQIGRTCYWGKCSFCCLNVAFSQKTLWRTTDQFVSYIQEIVERFNVNTFEFVDDAIPPMLAGRISDLLLEKGLSIRWFSYARFDSGFTKPLLRKMHEAGCVGLKFGLESASPRILGLMNKGINLEESERIVKDAIDVGMHCQVAFFVGFPTETEQDREMTIQFLRERVIPYGGVLSFNGWFRILKDMPIVQSVGFKDRVTKWNTSEDLIDYYVFDNTTFDEMQRFALHLKNGLFNGIVVDYVRSVDGRRYWFSGLCPLKDWVMKNGRSVTIRSHFNLKDIVEYRDKRFDDFRPGKGVYETKSYISTNLLGKDSISILNQAIVQDRGDERTVEMAF